MNTVKKIIYGLTLGLVVSVFINTIFIMLTSVWLVAYIFPVLIPAITICAIFITLTVKNKLRTPGYLAILGLLLLGVPLSYYLPVQIQTARFRSFSSSIPLQENSSKRISHLSVFGADDPSNVTTEIFGQAPIPVMLKFYSDYLKNSSWEKTEPTLDYVIREHYTYTKGSSKVHIIGYTSGQKSEINTVRVRREYPTMGFK